VNKSPSKITHRTDTGRYYRGIPIHAADGVHEAAAELITSRLARGKRILELGAGSGAMTQRLLDLGYEVTPVDLDGSSWKCGGRTSPD
jgi:2-polyprenyl-3-methyl-5-hydroxy-6-metoxy-1,4-benzoquinol methylase